MKYASPRSTSDRVGNSISRTTVQSVDDSHLCQEIKYNGFAGESADKIEQFHHYGFTSNVQTPTGEGSNTSAESIVVFLGGNRSHGVSLGVTDRRYRLKNLKPGEVALFDNAGQQIHFTRKGIATTVLNSQSHTHNIMPDKSSAMSKDQDGAGQGAIDQNGQLPWQQLIDDGKQAPYAYHSIDKDTRTTSHPGTVVHNIWDENDAKDKTIAASKKKIIHSNTLDQKKGSILSINKGKHKRTVDPDKGIVDSVNEGKHTRTVDSDKGIIDSVASGQHTRIIDAVKGIIDKTSASHTRTAAQGITDTAPNLNHDGNVNVTGNANITGNTAITGATSILGALSATGGMSSGALEVAKDSDGGLVQATMGLAVTAGLSTDTFAASGLAQCHDGLAVTLGLATDDL